MTPTMPSLLELLPHLLRNRTRNRAKEAMISATSTTAKMLPDIPSEATVTLLARGSIWVVGCMGVLIRLLLGLLALVLLLLWWWWWWLAILILG